MFTKLWQLINGYKTKAGAALSMISGALLVINQYSVMLPPAWVATALGSSLGVLLTGIVHKFVKLENASNELKPFIAALTPIIEGMAPIVKQAVTDIKAPIVAEPPKPGTAGHINVLVLLVTAALMCFILPYVQADDVSTPQQPKAWFHVGSIQGWYPLQQTDLDPALQGISSGNEYVGAKFKLVSWPPTPIELSWITLPENFASINYGAITSHLGNGDFYGSVSITPFQVASNGASFLSYISIGYLQDYHNHKNDEAIIGTSIPLGDIGAAFTQFLGLTQ